MRVINVKLVTVFLLNFMLLKLALSQVTGISYPALPKKGSRSLQDPARSSCCVMAPEI